MSQKIQIAFPESKEFADGVNIIP